MKIEIYNEYSIRREDGWQTTVRVEEKKRKKKKKLLLLLLLLLLRAAHPTVDGYVPSIASDGRGSKEQVRGVVLGLYAP